MPNISKKFLEAYGDALKKTLTEYMALKPNYSDEGRVKLTLQFMIEFNDRLLSVIRAVYRSRVNSKTQDDVISNLLLANSESDCEKGLNYSENMLAFYQDVSQNIENDPLKEYHENLRSSLLFYKPAFIVSAGLFAACLFLSQFYARPEGEIYHPNNDFLAYSMMMTPFFSYFTVMFAETRHHKAESEKALNKLQLFGQQQTYELPGTNHAENVASIKGWFENSNVFFRSSMAKMVDNNIVELDYSENGLNV